ncbi:MAG: hypothetical protein WKF84_19970 [Pyrinomonadaceae bacterium]
MESGAATTEAPLAERMRPRSLAEFVGQQQLVGEGRFLRSFIENRLSGAAFDYSLGSTRNLERPHSLACLPNKPMPISSLFLRFSQASRIFAPLP